MTEYARSGVNIDAKKALIERIRGAVHSTHGENVLAGVGAFGGMFQVGGEGWPAQPVLVASTDGVGTKTMLAAQAGRYHGLGHDIVNHCVNDILCQGARPLFFMDYVASSRLDPEAIAALIEGIAEACRGAGCALLGGETAEMPGVYQPGHFDLVGSIVGVTDQSTVLPSPIIRPGDVLIGFESSGPHTNGYSLIRRVFANVPLDTVFDDIGVLGDALLAPHASYLNIVTALRQVVPIKALAHITGGGFFENIPRVLPDGCGVEVDHATWNVPPLFALIQERGQVKDEEMYRIFN
ncbi:MAG TPA: phosphoribosylformylglycinamidine cyclo-ligase, partial [Aggregatilineales bacterium]|nr:phosphoribosylformylglycinamidine cyclo-ligase [Aggregatilineales bacterium]